MIAKRKSRTLLYNVLAHLSSGAHTWPDSNIGATEFTRTCLSLPLLGVKFTTGIPDDLNSSVNGSPEAFASTITVSGSQYLYLSIAIFLSSVNSHLPFSASSSIICGLFFTWMTKHAPCCNRAVVCCFFFTERGII